MFFSVICRALVSSEQSKHLSSRVSLPLPKILDQFFFQNGHYNLFLQNSSYDINAYMLTNYDESNEYARFLIKMKMVDQNYNFEKLHHPTEPHDLLLDDDVEAESVGDKIKQI